MDFFHFGTDSKKIFLLLTKLVFFGIYPIHISRPYPAAGRICWNLFQLLFSVQLLAWDPDPKKCEAIFFWRGEGGIYFHLPYFFYWKLKLIPKSVDPGYFFSLMSNIIINIFGSISSMELESRL